MILRNKNEISPNWHVLVSIFGQGIEEKVSLKPLILTPPAKIADHYLLLGFHRQFFGVRVPDIISKPKKQKTGSRNKIFIKFYIPQWRVDNVRTNNMVTPC